MVCTLSKSVFYQCNLVVEKIEMPEEGKKELKEALSAEEYEMVTATSEFKIKWFFFGKDHAKESD